MIKLLKLQKTKTKLFIEPENRKMEKFSAKRKTSNFNVYLTLILTLTLTLTDGGLTFNGGRFERTDGHSYLQRLLDTLSIMPLIYNFNPEYDLRSSRLLFHPLYHFQVQSFSITDLFPSFKSPSMSRCTFLCPSDDVRLVIFVFGSHKLRPGTGISLNIVFFSKNSRKFASSPSPAIGCYYWLYK